MERSCRWLSICVLEACAALGAVACTTVEQVSRPLRPEDVQRLSERVRARLVLVDYRAGTTGEEATVELSDMEIRADSIAGRAETGRVALDFADVNALSWETGSFGPGAGIGALLGVGLGLLAGGAIGGKSCGSCPLGQGSGVLLGAMLGAAAFGIVGALAGAHAAYRDQIDFKDRAADTGGHEVFDHGVARSADHGGLSRVPALIAEFEKAQSFPRPHWRPGSP